MFQEKFGDRALAHAFINQNQLDDALRVQAASDRSGIHLRLGEIFVRRKLMNPIQVKDCLRDQLIEIQMCTGCNRYFNCIAFEPNAIYRCPLCQRPLQYGFDPNVIAVEDDLEKEGQTYSTPDAIDQMLGLGPTPKPRPAPSKTDIRGTTEAVPPDELMKMLDQESKRVKSAPKPVPPNKGIVIRKPKRPQG